MLRVLYWLYEIPAASNDAELKLEDMRDISVQEVSPAVGSYGLDESTSLIDFTTPNSKSNALTVGQNANDPSSGFGDETISTLWTHVRLYRAALSFDIPSLADECVEKMVQTVRGCALAYGFVDIIRTIFEAAPLDIVQDGLTDVLAAECASQIGHLMKDEDFIRFLRERDYFSYLVIQKMIERPRVVDIEVEEVEPRLLITSATGSPKVETTRGLMAERDQDQGLIMELRLAVTALKDKHDVVVRQNDKLVKALAASRDDVSHPEGSTSASAIVRKGRGTFTEGLDVSAPGGTTIVPDDEEKIALLGQVRRTKTEHTALANRIRQLETENTAFKSKVLDLEQQLNQARLGKDDLVTEVLAKKDPFKKENDKFKKDNLALMKAKSALEEEYDVLVEEKSTLSFRIDVMARDLLKMANIEAKNNVLEKQISELQVDIDSAADLKAENDAREEKVFKLQTDIDAMAVKVPGAADLQVKNGALEEENSALRVRIDTMAMDTLEVTDLKSNNATLQAKLVELQLEVSTLHGQLSASQWPANTVRSDMALVHTQNAELSSAAGRLIDTLAPSLSPTLPAKTHGGVVTFAEKMMKARRRAAQLDTQSEAETPLVVRSATENVPVVSPPGVRSTTENAPPMSSPAVIRPATDKAPLMSSPALEASNSASVPSVTADAERKTSDVENIRPAANQTMKLAPNNTMQLAPHRRSQQSVPQATSSRSDREVNATPTENALIPSNAASVSATNPGVVAGPSSRELALEAVLARKAKEHEKTLRDLSFTQRQLTDARTGPSSLSRGPGAAPHGRPTSEFLSFSSIS